MIPAAFADQPSKAGSQPAAARWQRLKGKYEVTPSSSDRSMQLEQPKAGPAVKATPVSTTVVDPFEVDSPIVSNEQAPESRVLPQTAGIERPAIDPFDGADQVPVLPVAPATQLDPKTEEKLGIQTPTEPVGTPRSVRPFASAIVQGGPPRKTTQVRRISDIAPIDDFDRDSEIKQYAAEKAHEFNVRFGGDNYTPRNYPEVCMPWQAPSTKYYPLYFQDPALERYGHTHHHLVQPVVSVARMSGQLVMMPYQMAIVPPWELHSPLGWYRPGDVVPKLRYPFPWNAKAAAIEAAAVTGFIYVIP